jgi:hypothetical protein
MSYVATAYHVTALPHSSVVDFTMQNLRESPSKNEQQQKVDALPPTLPLPPFFVTEKPLRFSRKPVPKLAGWMGLKPATEPGHAISPFKFP